MKNDDLISRSELRARFQAILDRGDMFCEYDIVGMVDNAPTIETTIENLISTLSVEELKATTWFKVDTPSGEAISFRKEKTGQWVADDYAGIHCSECDYTPLKDVVRKIYADGTEEKSGNFNLTPYCPNCGAKMKKEK